MQIIKSGEKDIFYKIFDNLKRNEEERKELVLAIMTYNNILNSFCVLNDEKKEYVTYLNNYVSEAMELNNKEVKILKMMLRYLQLMKFNDCYSNYTNSSYCDYFEELVEFIDDNRTIRLGKNLLVIAATSMSIKGDTSNMSLFERIPVVDNLLTDDMYDEIIANIPRR